MSTIKKQEPTKNPTSTNPPSLAAISTTGDIPPQPKVIHYDISEKKGAQILNEMNDRPKKANTNTVSPKTTTPAAQKMVSTPSPKSKEGPTPKPITFVSVDTNASASEQKTTKVGIFDIKLSRLLWFYLCCAVVLGVLFYVYRFFCHFLAIRKLKNPFKTSQETADKTKPDSSDDGSYGGAGV